MHMRCYEVLVKDIKRYKFTDGQSKRLPVRHRVLVTPRVFADEGRTPPDSLVALFPVLVRISVWTKYTRAF